MTTAELGHKGEAAAAQYYLQRGCTLLAHNYRTRLGELDLVLDDHGMIVICEVKTRSPGGWGTPGQAVDARKQRRLTAAAARYLQETGRSDCTVRFDVVEVQPQNGSWQIHCIRAAFGS